MRKFSKIKPKDTLICSLCRKTNPIYKIELDNDINNTNDIFLTCSKCINKAKKIVSKQKEQYLKRIENNFNGVDMRKYINIKISKIGVLPAEGFYNSKKFNLKE